MLWAKAAMGFVLNKIDNN